MKILIDTNVALDIILNRRDFDESFAVFDFAGKSVFTGYISASTITDIFYIAERTLGKKSAKEALKELLQVFYPATVTDNNIYEALELDWSDFEDSVQYVVGKSFNVDYIITRNTQDYVSSSIPTVTPEQFIQAITEE